METSILRGNLNNDVSVGYRFTLNYYPLRSSRRSLLLVTPLRSSRQGLRLELLWSLYSR